MARLMIHRIPDWTSGAVGIKVVIDGQLQAQNLTLRRPDLDLELPPGPHTFVFRQWFGGSRQLHVNLTNRTGILVWANPDNGPRLFLKKNREEWVYARRATAAEIRDARVGVGKVGRPLRSTIVALVLWVLALGAWNSPIPDGGKLVSLVCAVGMTALGAWRWLLQLRRRRYG
ncbi:hypothetical protein [Cumulibacter manganitolerans]|uniref:hypothetical protein n=1 Tax=Cumulibacter manganitolerans TaxID=1884992 RepID=UPI0012956E6A|nr:hypothetical protein [Cumulibacter manganitolerans]